MENFLVPPNQFLDPFSQQSSPWITTRFNSLRAPTGSDAQLQQNQPDTLGPGQSHHGAVDIAHGREQHSERERFSFDSSDDLVHGPGIVQPQHSFPPAATQVPAYTVLEHNQHARSNAAIEPSRAGRRLVRKPVPTRVPVQNGQDRINGTNNLTTPISGASGSNVGVPNPEHQQSLPVIKVTNPHDSGEESEASVDVDVHDINPENLTTLDPHTQTAITEAARGFRSKSISSNRSSNDRLRASHDTSSVSDVDCPSDSEHLQYCCRKSKSLAQKNGPGIDYCPGCQSIFCGKHWRAQTSHRGRGSPGHVKTSPKVAMWVSATLENNSDDAKQAVEHLIDNNCTLWFGAGPDDRGVSVFRDFGRYSELMSEGDAPRRTRRFPALVSFVGETGAGKSSLIKLMISMFGNPGHQTPVVGSTANEDIPTSGDVHLYSDPNTFNTSEPILYADCEGLNGGTRDPVAAKYRKRSSANLEARQSQTPGLRTHLRQAPTSPERVILWADTPEKSSREFFVRHLYPRLLYTFSDVIVFVVKNVRAIENVIEHLITWADAVREASSNQPVLPHAIIVLNASDNRSTNLWDVGETTRELLSKVEEAMETNEQFKKYARSERRRGREIGSMHQLLLSYYKNVQVIRIPTRDQPSLIHDQVRKLYGEIQVAVKASMEFKLSVRMKPSSEELQPYLHNAFDHFCRTLTRPFDFVKASHSNCTIPSDFSGNILKLALNIMERWPNSIDGPLLFKELSLISASCIMLDAVRRGILGLAESMFSQYIAHFDEALEDFCDLYWPCEYVGPGGRCVNVRAGHSKGHQTANAQVVVPNASYYSTFTAKSYRKRFLDDVFQVLEELLRKLADLKRNGKLEEKDAAIKIHKEWVLKHFYRHLGGAAKFYSHSTCLACLMFAPQHCLPCGHILCTPCIEAFGRQRGQNAIDMVSCPLHGNTSFPQRETITLQPETAGVRVLTLDGGGIRGVVELVALQHIERELGSSLPVQAFFDLIVGTSTGGIIALGIGEKYWSVEECLQKFKSLASRVFARNSKFLLGYIDKIFTILQHGKYDTTTFESILAEQFGPERLFGGLKEDAWRSKYPRPKVAVTATSVDGTPYVFANYNRPEVGEHPLAYEFLRAERPEQEMKIQEVARATSAAPKIFKPYEHPATNKAFMDGGIYHNNPIEVAMQELRLAFPHLGNRPPDIVVSLGTGIGSDKVKKGANAASPQPKGPLSYYKHLIKIATDHVLHSLDSERTWQTYLSKHGIDTGLRWYRLNFTLTEKCPKLDEVSKMDSLMETVDNHLKKRKPEIQQIANRLIATTFYFRPFQKPRKLANGSMVLEGQFECRFPSGSDEIRSLGDLLLNRQSHSYNNNGAGEGPSFVFEERHKKSDAKQVFINPDTIEIMRDKGEFVMKDQKFIIFNHLAEIDIYFRFGNEPYDQQRNSISGFPRRWDVERRPYLRPSLSLSKKRVPEMQHERSEWLRPALQQPEILDRFASNDLPGLATQSDLDKVSQRWTEPGEPELQSLSRTSSLSVIASEGPHEVSGDTFFQTVSHRRELSEISEMAGSDTADPVSRFHTPEHLNMFTSTSGITMTPISPSSVHSGISLPYHEEKLAAVTAVEMPDNSVLVLPPRLLQLGRPTDRRRAMSH